MPIKMRKLLPVLFLAVLFVSCSSDDDNEDPNKGKETIDEKIIGKWKVEYSKTIKPAMYNESTGKPEYDETEAIITEYDGKLTSDINSYIFNSSERAIEITKDNIIKTYWFNTNGGITDAKKNVSYKVEYNYLKWTSGTNNPTAVVKYSIKDGKLIMELIRAEGMTLTYYTISEYSKITE